MIETDDPAESMATSRGDSVPQLTLPPSKLRRMGWVAVAVALLIAVAGIVDREIKERAVAHWTNEQAIPAVSVIRPQRNAGQTTVALPGNIDAWYEAPIYARVNGYLKDWYFDYGAHVKQGQVLATIETPDLDAQYAAAQADLGAARAKVNVAKAAMDFAKTTYDRWRESPKGVVSVQETESKKADYETALATYDASIADVKADQGAVDRLAALEQFKRIVAPFAGIVTQRNTDVGALINAGSGSGSGSAPVLFRIADVHEMRVYVQVPQAMSDGIKPGLTATLHLPQYPERTFTATVATTARAIDPVARTLLVELHADNAHGLLEPGTYAEVHFHLPANRDVLTIPATALIFQQAGMQVAVLGPGNRAELRSVTLGRNFGSNVEVLKGLSLNDQVINSPPDSLSAGERVDVVNPASSSSGELASTRRAVADAREHADAPPAQGSAANGQSDP